ncbi:MAG TPA: selenide, water dikinase SelD [Bacteroidales bacterium]|nr:selenide, water dikinase SelD [Bacteroidales bacterium]
MKHDLLKLVDQGGCSAKLSASELGKALADLPKITNQNVLVDIESHDDAGVYKIREDYALVQTTDFFPPVCSDPYDFGQVAAANALSDVYAMGGEVLTALNIVLFPTTLPLKILKEILRGTQDKVAEAGGVIVGGHTIANEVPVCGLSVTGWVHPDKIITNTGAKSGDVLILTKQIGTGVIISAKRNDLADAATYRAALDSMKHLNKNVAEVMRRFDIKGATDITGFGLLGHALKMAQGSGVSMKINAADVPVMDKVLDLIEMGCIPGAAFRNLEFAEKDIQFDPALDYNHKMLVADAQTSGGMLISVPNKKADQLLADLMEAGYPFAAVIGAVGEKSGKSVYIN